MSPGLSIISSSECQVCESVCVWAREWESEIGWLRVKYRSRKSTFLRKASVSFEQHVNTLPVNFHWCTSRAVNLSTETNSPCVLCVEMLCHLSRLQLCTLACPEKENKALNQRNKLSHLTRSWHWLANKLSNKNVDATLWCSTLAAIQKSRPEPCLSWRTCLCVEQQQQQPVCSLEAGVCVKVFLLPTWTKVKRKECSLLCSALSFPMNFFPSCLA